MEHPLEIKGGKVTVFMQYSFILASIEQLYMELISHQLAHSNICVIDMFLQPYSPQNVQQM